jgi:hypothetical protein
MTSERANAYGRVVRTIEDLGATKLHPEEIVRLRAAIDTLLFSEELSALGAREALEDAHAVCDHLADTGRWTPERARQLSRDIDETGPLTAV